MSKFKPEKLFVDFKNDVTEVGPIMPRYYTMTHSDETANLYVSIGLNYDWSKVTSMRDEVLGGWDKVLGKYILRLYIHVDGAGGLNASVFRDKIFREELPLAITAIRYADKELIEKYPYLDEAPIIVEFNSKYKEFSKIESWDKLKDYEIKET
ncbi:hypothetical protein JCM1393_13260 [Clostridium carnis]